MTGRDDFTAADARDALYAIDPGCGRDDWHAIGRAAIAAGLSVDEIDEWSSRGGNYSGTQDVRAAFKTITPEGGTGPRTLFGKARAAGWTPTDPKQSDKQRSTQAPRKPQEPPRKPAPGSSPAEVWNRCQPATNAHPYIKGKRAAGVPLDTLRVLPAGDTLRIGGASMAGALVVPAYALDGTLQSLQLIPPEGKKMNLPGAPMAGASHMVGTIAPDQPVYIVEGIGQAWACWQATGDAAVACFGAGNMRRIAEGLRQRNALARLVLAPDGGKEADARKIAQDVQAAVVEMPIGWENNSDVSDLAQRDGLDALEMLLEAASKPPKPEARYKLLGSADLAALPALVWRIRGVLPAVGVAALFGPSASGKSFLAFDMAAAIAEARRWFECRVEAAPVVYAALEGEAGFKLRAQAWEAHQGRKLPEWLHMVLQPFKLTEPQDVQDMAAVLPAGAVLFLDTLNRAAPTADENSSRDMGEILQAAKQLQGMTGGLVVLVHHTGKDATKGLRGHSSLFAAMDAAVEVSRDGDRREWRVAKAKDGNDGDAHPFKLQVETLAIDEHGDPVTSCVVVADHAARDVRSVKLPQGGNQKIVLTALRGIFRKDAQTGKPGAPPLAACLELEAAVTAAASALLVTPDRKAERARDAITGLVARGVLGCAEGWIWQI